MASNANTEQKQAKAAIEPGTLQLDLGYSIPEAKATFSLKVPMSAFSVQPSPNRHTIAFRKWWVRHKGRSFGKGSLIRPRSANAEIDCKEHAAVLFVTHALPRSLSVDSVVQIGIEKSSAS